MPSIKLIIQLWIAMSIIKSIAASNQQSYFKGCYCRGIAANIAHNEYDEEPPYSKVYQRIS